MMNRAGANRETRGAQPSSMAPSVNFRGSAGSEASLHPCVNLITHPLPGMWEHLYRYKRGREAEGRGEEQTGGLHPARQPY